jgi:hypothetical protein
VGTQAYWLKRGYRMRKRDAESTEPRPPGVQAPSQQDWDE